jgi:hypothetical protein
VSIRTFERGDEAVQVAIYNEGAGRLPRFKPANVEEVSRRAGAPEFDPSARFFALEGGQAVAYAAFNSNGRVSYPWCRKGHEHLAGPLFQHAMEEMANRGCRKAFAAYRADWPEVINFFRQRGFTVAREMVNFILDMVDLPTIPARTNTSVTALKRADVPAIFKLAPHVICCESPAELERHLFDNPHFPPTSVFVLRSGSGDALRGVGILVRNASFADPKAVDANMPCFRLGAFGTEGMQTKRINGLFSFLCRDDAQCGGIVVDLMEHASSLAQDYEDIATLAAEVPSTAPNWLRFYEMNWRRQGSFPVLERKLGG